MDFRTQNTMDLETEDFSSEELSQSQSVYSPSLSADSESSQSSQYSGASQCDVEHYLALLVYIESST